MQFSPIAIVGRGCVLPGALTPGVLWEAVRTGKDLLTSPPPGAWRISPDRITRSAKSGSTWSDRGGYIDGFEAVFDPTDFGISPAELRGLDVSVAWTLHAARAALREAGHQSIGGASRVGAVLGNLSLPTAELSRFAEAVWLEREPQLQGGNRREIAVGARPDPRSRFMSGLPSHLLARALGLGAGVFALDAACASSLYAIKLACDALHDRRADLMLAGAVNGTDPLFLHAGFRVLQALSPTGQSRPFHSAADGLVPSHGAALLAFKRLEDAEASGDRIYGVIRGIGLSNDGGGTGLLVPSSDGQMRALHQAYEVAGLTPNDISLIECHATGTPIGDATEIQSMAKLYQGLRDVPIGSLKSNIGHTLTVSGAAGLLKVLSAMEAGIRPPTLHVGSPLPAVSASPFRLLAEAEAWDVPGPRRAAVSSFGFGGNNAHLLVEQWEPGTHRQVHTTAELPPLDVAIVGLGVIAAGASNTEQFAKALFEWSPQLTEVEGQGLFGLASPVELLARNLRFPPHDLAQTLPQQVMVLGAAEEALAQSGELPSDRTGVYVGMQCDPEIARHMARVRLAQWGPAWANTSGTVMSDAWLAQAQAAFTGPLEPPTVLGTLPNIVANRLNAQFRLGGPSFSASAEELSGIVGLQVAMRALAAGELDAAVVGAVDMCCEPVHQDAASQLLGSDRQVPGDAAVVMVLKRLSDARRDGNQVYAVLPGQQTHEPAVPIRLGDGSESLRLDPLFGHAHAASGLLHVAAAALCCSHRGQPGPTGPWPWLTDGQQRSALVQTQALGGQSTRVCVQEVPEPLAVGFTTETKATIEVYSGLDRSGVLTALSDGQTSSAGPARLVIVAFGADEVQERRQQALDFLNGEVNRLPEGIWFRDVPISGELAFVFTGAGAAYHGMGRDLLVRMPDLITGVSERFRTLHRAAGWAYQPPVGDPTALEKLGGSSLLSQVHAQFSRGVLGLKPTAALGLSSGETNAVSALGAWNDLDGLLQGLEQEGIYSHELGGQFAALSRAWDGRPASWAGWRILLSANRVRAAIAEESQVYLTMIQGPADCAIGGDSVACDRVVARLGGQHAYPLGYDLAVHCPAVHEVRQIWRKLHHRPTTPVPGVRFYTSAKAGVIEADADQIADALTGMACDTVDFPRMIERAWDDGVRIFVEHGPRGLCTRWIGQTLGAREYVAVSLDRPGVPALRQACYAAGELVAAGVSVDLDRLLRQVGLDQESAPQGPVVRFAAHPQPVRLPAMAGGEGLQTMAPAPALPPVMAEWESSQPAPVKATTPSLTTAATTALDLGSASVPGSAAALARWHSDQAQAISAAHRDFLARQAQVHAQFVQSQVGLWSRLAAALGGTVPAGAIPAGDLPMELTQAVVTSPAPSATPARPMFDRSDLEQLASGSISALFGPLFAEQDQYKRQVRMPMPPLLLADRVVSIYAEPGSMGTGSIITETDVAPDSWYLHDGCMPVGIQVEAGQADLLLCSWLGADLLSKGERVYRLLGCELTFHGERPRPGNTIRYDIHIDRHARSGDVRLFFFHYGSTVNGNPSLSVRDGHAGFFTDLELLNSGGVVWDPAAEQPEPPANPAAPAVVGTRSAFTADQVQAFAQGRPYDCFGPGFELAAPHVRSPRIQDGDMLLLGEVTSIDPRGGPWGQGYLRAVTHIQGDEWFFPGHFKNDPTMPGTLMYEGGLQAMALYMAAQGHTIDRDGWRFEPVTEVPYKMVCRGQVVPTAREIVYEIFVHGVEGGQEPTLWADILLTVDGLKAFHCRRMGLRLVPDWPLSSQPELLQADANPKPVAVVDGFPFDQASLLNCAWGKPSQAFGPRYTGFDSYRRVPRLPGPPYHFMSRVTHLQGEMGVPQVGTTVEVEYDMPPDAWYFQENPSHTMPFCVLLEAALQPCGWLTAYMGVPLTNEVDLSFRNLNGAGTLLGEITPKAGTLRTVVTCTDYSRSGDTYIESFDVNCYVGENLVYTLKTTFGHFPKAALARQVGVPYTDADRIALLDESPTDFKFDLKAAGPVAALHLADGKLGLLDRVTGYWPTGGKAGKGRLRAEMDVDPAAWFFKAHFFQDPVQPGSLGLEVMVQLLQFYMVHNDMGAGLTNPHFEALAVDRAMSWKYRGQVLPTNKRVYVEMEITDQGRDSQGTYAVADAWLWVDGMRIYSAQNLAVRVVPGDGKALATAISETVEVLDPAVDTWLADHCPTYTLPALPMTFMADRLARAAQALRPDLHVVGLEDVAVRRWLICDQPRRLATEVAPVPDLDLAFDVTLLAWRESTVPALSRYEPVATGRVLMAPTYSTAPDTLPTLEGGAKAPDPYASGALIHGPAFHILRELTLVPNGSTALLDAGGGGVPPGLLGQLLLDGITHAIPNADLWQWSDQISPDQVAYPTRILSASFHGPTPTLGDVTCEVRFDGFHEHHLSPRFVVQLLTDGQVWADLVLVAGLFPKGPIGRLPGLERRAFIKDGVAVPGAGLSSFDGTTTRLTDMEVRESDWLPGTLSHLYQIKGNPGFMTRAIAIKDHVARQSGFHPSTVSVAADGSTAVCEHLPATQYSLSVTEVDGVVQVTDTADARADFSAARDYWRNRLGVSRWPVEDMYFAMAEKFVRRIVLTDPAGFARLKGRSVLYVANHQVAVESFLFALLTPGLTGVPNVVLAKSEVQTRWLDEFLTHAEAYPGVSLPSFIIYLNQQDPVQVLQTFEACREQMVSEGLSALVHVEGTRGVSCRNPVNVISSSLIDMALGANAPIVPVRFAGGLPVKPLESRLHIPVGHGTQDYYYGRAIFPEELAALPYVRRREAVLAAINGLGPVWSEAEPNPPNAHFETEVKSWMAQTGVGEEYSILLKAVQHMRDPGPEIGRIITAATHGSLVVDNTPKGDWTAVLGQRLFGERGPRVVKGPSDR